MAKEPHTSFYVIPAEVFERIEGLIAQIQHLVFVRVEEQLTELQNHLMDIYSNYEITPKKRD